MKHSDFDHYLEALGFEAGPYVRPGDPVPTLPTPIAQSGVRDTLLILTGLLSPAARDLSSKMLQAMQLPTKQLCHLETDDANGIEPALRERVAVCLVLGFDLAASLTGQNSSSDLRGQAHRHADWPGVEIWATHSPQDCLNDGALKRPVWEDLQHVMRLFSERGSL